jgi:hypothetical protein
MPPFCPPWSRAYCWLSKAEQVPRKAALDATDHLLELHAHLLGAVLNDMPLQRDSYYYRHY